MDEPEVVSEEDLIHVELCPSCKTQQIHSILTERDVGGGVDYRTQCEGCSHVHLSQVEYQGSHYKRLFRAPVFEAHTDTRTIVF